MAYFQNYFQIFKFLKLRRTLTQETYDLPAEIMHREIIDVQSCGDKWIEIWHHRGS
jgi:hypothetical protein